MHSLKAVGSSITLDGLVVHRVHPLASLVFLFVVVFVIAIPSEIGAQDFCFGATATIPCGLYPGSLLAADLDGDGDIDLLTTTQNSDEVVVLKNMGNGSYSPPVAYSVFSPIQAVAADLDSDADLDLVIANNPYVSILDNAGDGSFGAPRVIASVSPVFVGATDIDGDGDLDLVTANGGRSTISTMMNDGGATFSAPVTMGAGNNPICIAATDLDGDGDADLAVVNNGSHDFSVFPNLGGGSFGTPDNYACGFYPRSVIAVDLSADGTVDVAIACAGSQAVSVHLNDGEGSFAAGQLTSIGRAPSSICAADLDADGDSDLALAGWAAPVPTANGSFTVLSNDGHGGFSAPRHYGAGQGTRSVVAGDLNGDGDIDLAAANYGNASVAVLENKGDGSFPSGVTEYPAGSAPNSLVAEDFNGDCHLDITVANAFTGTISVLTNQLDGTLATALTYPAGVSPRSVVSADFDRDGARDLAVLNYGAGTASVLRNNGDGTFATPVAYPVGDYANYAIVADCDRANGPDLVVTRGDEHLAVLLNNGDGTFAARMESESICGRISTGDIDRDGDIDLVTLCGYSNGSLIAILTNSGDGTFAPPVTYFSGFGSNSLVAADLDNNGWPDIAVANGGSDLGGGRSVAVLLNNRDGTLRFPIEYPLGDSPVSITAGDLDSDGDIDLAAGGSSGGNTHILRNNGNGTFSAAMGYVVGTYQYTIQACDLEGNGNLELLILRSASNNVAVLSNCGPLLESTVSSVNDHGPGSLRSALTYANLHPGPDTITFAVSGGISLTSPLPSLADHCGGTVIQGFTAPGSVSPWVPTIRIGGDGKDETAGLTIESSNNIVEGVAIYSNLGAGVAVSGANALSNTITACQFYGNQGPGIDVGDDGVTENDFGDGDTGPNGFINFPVFDSVSQASGDTFSVFGTAGPGSRIELFLAAKRGNPALQPEETAHGPAYLLLDWVVADANGQFYVDSVVLPEWSRVTATATDTLGNTSELAKNKLLTPDPLRITAYSEAPPLSGKSEDQFLLSPAVQVTVIGPVDEQGRVDTIGPAINTFGSRATYDSLTDYNGGGLPDARVVISSPDTGLYNIIYTLVGSPGEYLTGIGIDGHAEVYQTIEFVSVSGRMPSSDVSATYHLAPPNRGELTGDDIIQLEDIMTLVSIVFFGGGVPNFEELSDVDCDGLVNAVDLADLIDYVYFDGHPPCD